MIKKIAIIYSLNDLAEFEKIMDENWITISDFNIQHASAKSINAKLTKCDEIKLSEDVKNVFKLLEKELQCNSLMGFSNAFYECTIAPIGAYLTNLKKILDSLKDDVEIWFPSRFLLTSHYSCYYMGEHESQGKLFYSRNAVFQPYLISLSRLYKLKICYLHVEIGVKPFLHRPLRIAAVYCWRFINGVFNKVSQSKIEENYFKTDIIAVTRTISQTEFLEPFLTKCGLTTAIFAGEAALSRGANRRMVSTIELNNPSIVGLSPESSIIFLIKKYFCSMNMMLKKKSVRLMVEGISLNLNQAINEVLVMWPDLEAHIHSLNQMLGKIPFPSTGILISTEQKSPYAHGDALVAKENGLVCVHFMHCDQSPRPLPFPVAGDFFLADSESNAFAFQKNWKADVDKIKYIGTLKACTNVSLSSMSSASKNPVTWCFFTQVDDIKTNHSVLLELRNIRSILPIKIIIKLHPRDDISHYKSFDDFVFYKNGELRKVQLYDIFDFAISSPSGVVQDLIFNNKPFLLLRFGRWNSTDQPYIDDNYACNIADIVNLNFYFTNPDLLISEFGKYRLNYFTKNTIIYKTNLIHAALLKLND